MTYAPGGSGTSIRNFSITSSLPASGIGASVPSTWCVFSSFLELLPSPGRRGRASRYSHSPPEDKRRAAGRLSLLDLSQTMDAIDLDPTRLERAKLKLRDLLKVRDGGRTALFVYSGTAHMVLPFTTDFSLFDLYLSSLSTSLMPVNGKDTAGALHSIQDLLKDETCSRHHSLRHRRYRASGSERIPAVRRAE